MTAGALTRLLESINHVGTRAGLSVYPKITVSEDTHRQHREPWPGHVWLRKRSCIAALFRDRRTYTETLKENVGKPVACATLSFLEISFNWNLGQGPTLGVVARDL